MVTFIKRADGLFIINGECRHPFLATLTIFFQTGWTDRLFSGGFTLSYPVQRSKNAKSYHTYKKNNEYLCNNFAKNGLYKKKELKFWPRFIQIGL